MGTPSRRECERVLYSHFTTWQGRAAMRISVSNWSTDETDVDRSVQAILRCAAGSG